MKEVKIFKYRVKVKLVIIIAASLIAVALIVFTYFIEMKFNELFFSIGIELIGGLLLFVLLDKEFQKIMSNRGAKTPVQIPEEIISLLAKMESNRTIRILTTFFNFIENPKKESDFLTGIIDSIDKKNSTVQILILDPISYAAIQRFKNMKNVNNAQFDTIKKAFKSLNKLNDIYPRLSKHRIGKLEVKIFNQLPPYILYQVDNTLNMSFYSENSIAAEEPFWKVGNESEFAEFVTDKFNKIWQQSVCTLDKYFEIAFFTNKKDQINGIRFIDVYDKASGDFFDNRVLAYSNIEKAVPDEIEYRGRRSKCKKVDLEFNNNNIVVTQNGNSIIASTKETNLENYLRSLWRSKYTTDSEEGVPDNFSFVQVRIS